MVDISVVTFNVRGLRETTKRRSIFRYCHQHFPDHIIALQETHSARNDMAYWQSEWGAPIFFSHGRSSNDSGVAMLFPRSLAGFCKVEVRHQDDNGRLLIVCLEHDQLKLTIGVVYAPTQSHSLQQVTFLEYLRDKLNDMSPGENHNLILVGDFNLHRSSLDVYNGRYRLTAAGRLLSQILEELNLVDVWRNRYKDRRQYTWRRLNPLQQSRIDYVFANDTLISNHVVKRIEIKPGILSDHSFVNVQFEIFKSQRGPGLWKFNNSLLEDVDFVAWVRLEIEKAKNNQDLYADVDDMGLKIEMMTSAIRAQSIKVSKQKARHRREKSEAIMQEIQECENRMCENPCDEAIDNYNTLRMRIDQIEEEKGRIAMVHSGARWIEEGEKPTRYFLRMNADRSSKKQMRVLQAPNGDLITGDKEILQFCHDYFKDMYESKVDEAGVYSFLQSSACPRLNEGDKESCEGPITNQECKTALNGMLNNKAPSVSGFSKEFFNFFWSELGNMVVDYVNQAKQDGRFFITQRRGVLTLIPKKGDQKLIRNKRAICLLDIIYKIVAKVIANRLASVIKKVVAPDQTGSIKGRYIGTNLRTIADVIYYCNADKVNGVLMALDFRNAFNTVERNFLYTALKEFNFGDDFIRWVKLLHSGSEIAIINNGYTSNWFRVARGLQQGCPASAPLFALAVEILAIKLRGARSVQGVEIAGKHFKLSQYCDDMTLFVKDGVSAANAIEMVEQFGLVSGLELNLEKCDFMWLGEKRFCEQSICGHPSAEKVKILGIWFSSRHDCTGENVEAVKSRIKRTMDQWSQRDLTIKGKITVVKSLLVSQMVYLLTAARIDRKCLAQIQSHIMQFVWRGRPPKVALKTLKMSVEKGGLKIPDTVLMDKAYRIAWIGRLMRLQDATFAQVLQERLKLHVRDIVRMDYDDKWMQTVQIPDFYKEMFSWFRGVRLIKEPENGMDIRRQSIWRNNFIRVQNRTLFHKRLAESGVHLIDDFLDSNGAFLSYQAFSLRFPTVRINPLVYMGWCSAIPVQWKRIVRHTPMLLEDERLQIPTVVIKGKDVPLTCIKTSFFYGAQLTDWIPAAQKRWGDEGVDFGDNWIKVYALPFKITTSTKLQSLQYRILHRYWPTRKYLCIRKIVDDPFCDHCGEIETLEHCLFGCTEVEAFWVELRETLNAICDFRIRLTSFDVIFGSTRYMDIINFIILIAKQFVLQQRYHDGLLTVNIFRHRLQRAFDIEKTNAFANLKVERFRKRWGPFISERNTLMF